MKSLESAKADFLLEAPLEILHEESIEWLDEIEFWKDEAAFFYKLILQKSKEKNSGFNSDQAKPAERHLVHVSVQKLDELKAQVQDHEKYLSYILENKKPDDRLFRSRHKAIAGQFNDFANEFRRMKKEIFRLAEPNPARQTSLK